MSAESGHNPVSIFLKVWALLFVVSFFSYLVDYFGFQGFWRWTLVLFFMVVKAGFIIAIFMHAFWERISLITTILAPPVLLLFLIGFMAYEGLYTEDTRVQYLGQDPNKEPNMEALHH